jgi:uncharacterized protein (DUF983 family)
MATEVLSLLHVPPVIDADSVVVAQSVFVPETANAAGWVNVTVFVILALVASVIVQVYVFADKPVAVALVPPLGAHE